MTGINRRQFLALTAATAAGRTAGRPKPNIIFTLADDLGLGDLGCYGQTRIATPAIDRLAAEGMRFTDAYSGSTICAPSRCCLMTGRHTGHAWVRGNFSPQVPLRAADFTVAQLLKRSGYATGGFGKWALGDDNTIVFFSSDNGPAGSFGRDNGFFRSKGPLRGMKRDLYEGGIRAPFLVRWPGTIRPGSVSSQMCAFWDFLPTVADICGVPAPPGIDGISILPALAGEPWRGHEFLYWEWQQKVFKQAVRLGDWKAVRLGQENPVELYDLKSDMGERHDVAAQHPGVVARVKRVMQAEHSDSPLSPNRDSSGGDA